MAPLTLSKSPELLPKPSKVAPKPTIEEKKMSILDKIAKEALLRPVTRGSRPKKSRNGVHAHFSSDKLGFSQKNLHSLLVV